MVFDKTLTEYNFGPTHPMSPLRVDLTMRLAEELGVLEHLRVVPAPVADVDLIATVHTRGLIDAVTRCGTTPGETDLEHGLGTEDDPVFEGMHEAAAHVVGASVEAFRQVWSGEIAAQRQHRRRPAPRDGRPGERLLHLQRRRRRHPVAAGPGRRAGGLRRRRRPPRRRRRGDLLRRPAGADGLAARDRPDAVPRHRVPHRHRRPERRGLGRERRPPARHRRRWLAARLPCRRTPGAAGVRPPGPGHPARLRLPHGGPARPPDAERRRPAGGVPRPARAGPRALRREVGRDRRRRLRHRRGRAARVDPPAGHRRRPAAGPRHRDAADAGASTSTP